MGDQGPGAMLGPHISGRVLERDSENSTLDGVPSGYVKIAIENDQL